MDIKTIGKFILPALFYGTISLNSYAKAEEGLKTTETVIEQKLTEDDMRFILKEKENLSDAEVEEIINKSRTAEEKLKREKDYIKKLYQSKNIDVIAPEEFNKLIGTGQNITQTTQPKKETESERIRRALKEQDEYDKKLKKKEKSTSQKIQHYIGASVHTGLRTDKETESVTIPDITNTPIITNYKNDVGIWSSRINIEPKIEINKTLRLYGIVNYGIDKGSGTLTGDKLEDLVDTSLDAGLGVKVLKGKIKGGRLDFGYNNMNTHAKIISSDEIIDADKRVKGDGFFARFSLEDLPLNTRFALYYSRNKGKGKTDVNVNLSSIGVPNSQTITEFNSTEERYNLFLESYLLNIGRNQVAPILGLSRDYIREVGHLARIDSISPGLVYRFKFSDYQPKIILLDEIRDVTVDDQSVKIKRGNTLKILFGLDFGANSRDYK